MQPPATAGYPWNGTDYAWITWALSYKLSLGGSLQRSYSTNLFTDGLWGLTAGVTYRPFPQLSIAAVAHDFNGPGSNVLPATGFAVLDQSYVFSAALRPTGRRELELALDVRYLQSSDQFIPRASLGIDVPYVGRARGDIEIAHLPNDDRRGVVATAGLELGLGGHSSVGGGFAFGNGLGKTGSMGAFGTAAVHGYGYGRACRAAAARST